MMPTGCARRWCAVGVVLVSVLAGAAPVARPEVLKIKVIDAVTGKALRGVSLQYFVYSAGGRTHMETTSLGPGGTTALTWSQVDKYYLTFSFSIGKRGVVVQRTVKATDANAASLIVRIPTDRYKKPLIVTVLNAVTGKPVPNARINLSFHNTGGAGSTSHEWAATTAGGKVSFKWAGEGKYRIWCSQIDGRKLSRFYVSMELTDDSWKAGKLTWKIKVPKLAARVKVFLLSKGKKTPAPDGAIFGVRTVKKDKSGTKSRELETVCKDGKVEFHGLEAGSVNTFCILTGARVHKHVPIDVKPWAFKGKVLNLEVTLVPVGEYRAKMTVRVIDEKGAPVAGAGVDISGPAGGESSTNSAGVATWTRLSIGRYTVTARKPGYPVVSRRGVFLPRTDDVVITLGKTYSLDVRVLALGGKPASSAICQAMPLSQDAAQQEKFRIEKGRARLEQLNKGYYLVTARAGKRRQEMLKGGRGGAVVDPATAKQVTIRLRKLYSVQLKLTGGPAARLGAQPKVTLVSPEAKELLRDRAGTVLLSATTYLVYLKMADKQHVPVGRRTVTGAETLMFDLKGVDLGKANWVSDEQLFRLFLPKARPATTRPTTNRAATRASK